MAELIILLVIAVGLCRRQGQPWEWSRARLRRAVETAAGRGEGVLGRGVRAAPGILGQCVEDVRSLIADMLGIIDPKARRRIARETRSFLSVAPRRARRLRKAAASPLMASGPASVARASSGESGAAAFARLQRRYLDGAISLDEYVTESRRLDPSGDGD